MGGSVKIYFVIGIIAAVYQFGASYAWARGKYHMLDCRTEDIAISAVTAVITLFVWPATLISTFVTFRPYRYGWWLWPSKAERKAHTERYTAYWRG